MRVHGPYDAVILLECDGLERARLRGLENFFVINIDHHISGRPYAHINWIDYGAASVGELVYRLVKAARATVTPEMATCLYTTVLTDTGGFAYGSVRASTFALAQDLVLAGADPVAIARQVCYSDAHIKGYCFWSGADESEARGTLGLAVGHASGHRCAPALPRRIVRAS